jgi:hypothetical protein
MGTHRRTTGVHRAVVPARPWRRRSVVISVVLAMLVALGVTVAIAAYTPGEQDLTYLDATAELNDGGVIQQSFAGNVGTGNLLSFLRVQNSPSEQGYNTSDRRSGGTKIFYGPSSSAVGTDDKTDGNFTRDLPLNVVPLVSYTPPGGTAGLYREFRLDLNENSGSGALVSLTRADVWIGTATEINYFETGLGDFESFSSGSSVAGSADLVWSMANNTWVILNADLSSGSGKNGDARLLVPESAFEIAGATDCPYNPDATDCGTYVYFDTEFGEVPETTGSTSVGSAGIESISDSTFEEWSTRKVPYVTKTATTSVTRTYDWTITKSVTPDAHQLFDGDSDTSDYTITVTKGAPVDSGFTVEGVITINNPSGSDTIRVTDITDTIDGYGEATVDCGTLTVPFEIDGGDSVECSYTATAPGSTNPFGDENTVVVDYGYVDKQGGLSLEDTTAAKADIDFSSPSVTTVNGSVTVTDTFESDAAHGLGTISSSTTFTQSDDSYLRRTFDCSDVTFAAEATASDTVEYDNTARITSTDGLDKSDDASVDVTCYKPTITKDANTSFTRTYNWTIDKDALDADGNPIGSEGLMLNQGQSYNLHWTITVELDGTTPYTDSAFGIDGSIYVTNTHLTDSMTVSLSDTLTGSDAVAVSIGACTGDGVSGTYDALTITAGSMATCSYSASPTGKDVTKNTASFTLFGKSYSGDADVDFSDGAADITKVNATVKVTDTFPYPGGTETDLGTVSVTDPLPKTFDFYTLLSTDANDNPDFLLVCEENLITNRADVYNYDDSILGARLGYDTRDVPVYVTCEVGCTLTQGYWKTHSSYGPAPDDENWLLVLPDGPDTTFFYSGQSWYEVFWTPPKGGNAYYQLAHQWMAATLNVLAGASTTTEVDAALADAEAWFDNPAHTPEYAGSLHGKNGKEERAQLIEWAGILGDYNTGLIGPGHCDEDGYTKLDTAAAASAGFLVLFGAFELIRKRREEL